MTNFWHNDSPCCHSTEFTLPFRHAMPHPTHFLPDRCFKPERMNFEWNLCAVKWIWWMNKMFTKTVQTCLKACMVFRLHHFFICIVLHFSDFRDRETFTMSIAAHLMDSECCQNTHGWFESHYSRQLMSQMGRHGWGPDCWWWCRLQHKPWYQSILLQCFFREQKWMDFWKHPVALVTLQVTLHTVQSHQTFVGPNPRETCFLLFYWTL